MGINSSTSSSRLSTTIPPTKSALDASVPIFSQLAYSRSLFSSRFIFFFFFLTRPRVSLSICLSIRPSRSLFDSVSLHSHIDHLVRVSLWNVFLCRPFDIVLLSLVLSHFGRSRSRRTGRSPAFRTFSCGLAAAPRRTPASTKAAHSCTVVT